MTYKIASYNLRRVLDGGNFARRILGDRVIKSLRRDWLGRWSITFEAAPVPAACDIHPDCETQGCEGIPIDCPRVRGIRSGKIISETNPSAPCSWVKRVFEEGT